MSEIPSFFFRFIGGGAAAFVSMAFFSMLGVKPPSMWEFLILSSLLCLIIKDEFEKEIPTDE